MSRLFHGWRGLACLNLIGGAQAECAECRVTILAEAEVRDKMQNYKFQLPVERRKTEYKHCVRYVV